MKKVTIIISIITLFLTSAAARTLNVGPERQYKDLQSAINASKSGDTIIIDQGVYEAELPIFIHDRESLTIEGNGFVDLITTIFVHSISIISSSDITLRNIHSVHKMGAEYVTCDGAHVVHIEDSEEIIIENCELNGCGEIGIYAYESRDILIQDNYIHSNTTSGISIYNYEEAYGDIIIRNNRIINNYIPISYDGTYIYFDSDAEHFQTKHSWLEMEDNIIYPED